MTASNLPPAPSGAGLGPSNGFAIAPNDTQQLPFLCKQIYVGGTGTLTLVLMNGDTVTLTAVPVGTMLTMNVVKVLATGTSATLLVGLY